MNEGSSTGSQGSAITANTFAQLLGEDCDQAKLTPSSNGLVAEHCSKCRRRCAVDGQRYHPGGGSYKGETCYRLDLSAVPCLRCHQSIYSDLLRRSCLPCRLLARRKGLLCWALHQSQGQTELLTTWPSHCRMMVYKLCLYLYTTLMPRRVSIQNQTRPPASTSTCMAKMPAHSRECICAKDPMSWCKMHLHICALCQLVGAALLTCIRRQCIPAMQATFGEKIPRRLQDIPSATCSVIRTSLL